MWTNDLQQLIAERGLTESDLPPQPKNLHHALADARHNAMLSARLRAEFRME